MSKKEIVIKIEEVKRRISSIVKYSNSLYYSENVDYLLTACILRKNDSGQFFYQAELTDVKQPKSTSIVRLEDIS